MKIIIMGLGIYPKGSGVSAAKFFISRGEDVLITDLKTRRELAHQIAELKKFCRQHNQKMPALHLGGHSKKDFENADMVMRNPGVPNNSPFLIAARKAGAKIETDISVFLKNCPAEIIGVTGTRGKSTTATLIYEFLKTAGRRVHLGGNIKISPLSFADSVKPHDIVVLELSSWMLENFSEYKLAPRIAVVTNIYPDHLNMHRDMAEYISAKKNIFKRQGAGDYLILNGENAKTRKWKGPGTTIYFSKNDIIAFRKLPMKLQGEHNMENVAAALAAAKIMKVPPAKIKKVLRGFKGLSDRQEIVAKKRGITYINDTTATSPEGAVAALRAFGQRQKDKKIILICGGKDKNLEYDKLAGEIKKYCKAVILLPGTATDKIKNKLQAAGRRPPATAAENMADAVNIAKRQAVKGDLVLLSPAAASFGLFHNEFDRGEKFKKEVRLAG